MVKQVTRYMTDDGELHSCVSDAREHEKARSVEEQLQRFARAQYEDFADEHDLAKWLFLHRDDLQSIMEHWLLYDDKFNRVRDPHPFVPSELE